MIEGGDKHDCVVVVSCLTRVNIETSLWAC